MKKIVGVLACLVHIAAAVAALITAEDKVRAFLVIALPLILTGVLLILATRKFSDLQKIIPMAVGLVVSAVYISIVSSIFKGSEPESAIGLAIYLLFCVWLYAIAAISTIVFYNRKLMKTH